MISSDWGRYRVRRRRDVKQRAVDLRHERLQRAIDAEHAQSLQLMRQDGLVRSAADYPAVHDLLEAVREAARRGHRFAGGTFLYQGRRFPVRATTGGRIVVIHPSTGHAIGSTGWGVL